MKQPKSSKRSTRRVIKIFNKEKFVQQGQLYLNAVMQEV